MLFQGAAVRDAGPAGGAKLSASAIPFLPRGVNLLGTDLARKQLHAKTRPVGLADAPQVGEPMLAPGPGPRGVDRRRGALTERRHLRFGGPRSSEPRSSGPRAAAAFAYPDKVNNWHFKVKSEHSLPGTLV